MNALQRAWDRAGGLLARRASRAATVRAVAGAPVGLDGAAGSGRRGTVLVIVLGTLALIAVIAVVYAVVGQADRRASAAFVGSVRREEMPALVRDYLADIVARDAVATYRDGAGDLKRESFDYPFTDPYLRSVVVGASGAGDPPVPANERVAQTFNPEGSYWSPSLFSGTIANVQSRASVGNILELRVPGDPWLAATQATNLRLDDDVPDQGYRQFNMRDWAHISNVSPDGRFVNLWNLRNNFRAASGFDFGNREISSRLTLYGPTGLPFAVSVKSQLDGGGVANPNNPSHWTNRQRGAFRPSTGMPTIGWSQAENPLYQWADADGDGFFDARWFEFVDLSGGVNLPRGIFPPDPTYRWFGAVRIVDLSAAVNLNTATDFLAAPASPQANYAAPGGTPADVDLRRLLTGEDMRELAGSIGGGAVAVGYEGLRPPLVAGTNTPDPDSAQFTGLAGLSYAPFTNTPLSELVGDAAYNHIRYFLNWGLIAPPATTRLDLTTSDGFRQYISQQHGVGVGPADLLRYQTIAARRDWYDVAAGSILGSEISVSQFTIDSEAELLTFRGANDPSFVSTLELVADGRLDNGDGANVTTGSFEYGPMRSSRLATVELAARDRSTGLVTPPGSVGAVQPDGVGDLDAMTQALTDIRQYVTSLSASRPLRNSFVSVNATTPVPAMNAGDQPLLLSALTGNARSLFSVYSNALLPYSGIEETWLPLGDPDGDPYRTLCYGYAGAELSIWHAAHLAVNMADAADTDATPRVATVIVDESVRDDLNADYDPPPPPGQNPTGQVATVAMSGRQNKWAAWVDGGNFDLGANRIADTNGGIATPIHPAFNVYGVEPQPFLAEVSAIILYTDAPDSAGGDDEPDFSEVTIDGRRLAGNSDVAFQAIAFQITNPFDVSIDLSGDSAISESKFYIEFGGRHYRVPNADSRAPGWSGTLGPRETRVFYAPARPMDDFEARWNLFSTGSGSLMDAFTQSIMGVKVVGGGGAQGGVPIQLSEFDPRTGADVPFVAAGSVLPGTYVDRFLPTGTGTIAEARLWRTFLATGQTSSNQPAEEYVSNALENDILADRFRDPNAGGATPLVLQPELDLPNDRVSNARKIPDGPGETETNYDIGLSVLLWSTIRRPSDDQARATTANQVVWIPAYCLEPKHGATFNTDEDDALPRTSLSATNFDTGSRNELALTFSSLLANVSGATIIDTLASHPHEKSHDDMGANLQGDPWSSLITELHNGLGSGTARPLSPADLLVARGIGASMAVDSSMSVTANSWTTLGEATLLALDYDQGTQGVDVLWRPGRPQASPTTLARGSLDKGHLLIDQFVPFYDQDPDGGLFDPDEDTPYGDAQPLALGVVAQVRTLADNYGTFRRGTPGLININTAPLAVLRALPMLSPTHGTDPKSPGSGPGSAWSAFNGAATTGQGTTSDAASMLLAARDKLAVYPRGDQVFNPPPFPDDQIDFTPGRRQTTGIDAIREVPGFRSVAEVLTARELNNRRLTGVPGLHDVDRLGFDNTRVTLAGFDPVVYPNTVTDPLTDEFDERLILANSILGSVTVRSDVYACWFVLHGYRESDCTGLATDDPLIPSVSRRFLMILDRSSVIAPGDKPAILLFKEVPYSPTTAGDGSAI